MPPSFTDQRFSYIEQLCSSISKYTQGVVDVNPKNLLYRGANLRFAIERALYFSFICDEALYQAFIQSRIKKRENNIKISGFFREELANIFCQIKLDSKKIIFRRLKIYFFINILKLPTKRILNYFKNKKINLVGIKKYPQLVFCVQEKKEVRYLMSIVNQLKQPYACLPLDEKLFGLLEEYKLPFIKYSFSYQTNINYLANPYVSSFGLADIYDNIFRIFSVVKPKIVAVVEGNAPLHEVINQVCKQLNIPVICIQQGWSPIIHNGFRNLSYQKMLVWGKGFAKILEPFNPELKFKVTGNHSVKLATRSQNKKKIHSKNIIFLMQPPAQINSQYHLDQFIALAIWTAKNFSQYNVIISQPPRINLDVSVQQKLLQIPRLSLLASGQTSLDEFGQILRSSYLAVAIYSTTILESIAVGVLPLVFNITSMPRYFPDVDAAGAGIEVKSLKQAKAALRRLINDPKYYQSFIKGMDKFRKEYFSAGGKEAIKNIVKELELTDYGKKV